jgi:predicted amidohydrolase
MRVTCVQLKMKDQSREKTINDLFQKLEEVPESDLIMLPELWSTGFFRFSQYHAEGEEIGGSLASRLRQVAVERGCYFHMGSFVEQDSVGFYNTSLLFSPEGKTIASYRKMHLFGYQSEEQQLLTPGKTVVTAKTDFGTVGLSTCYDLRFPELFRKMVDAGASVFLVTSAWPKARLEAWKIFCRARALENLSFLIACNCCGQNEGNQYAGHSMIISPQGEVLAAAGEEELILSLEIDTEESNIFRSSFPALNDRVL